MLSEPIPVKSRERSLESSSQGRCPPGSNDNINVDFASYCLHGAFLFLSDIVAWNCILSIMYTLGVDWVIELFAVIGYSHDVLLPRSSSISRSTRYSLSQKCYVGSVTKPPTPKKKKRKKKSILTLFIGWYALVRHLQLSRKRKCIPFLYNVLGEYVDGTDLMD